MKKYIIFLLASLLLLSSVLSVFSSSEKNTETVRMGFFEFGGMLDGASDGEKKSGYVYEYMMEVAVYSGWNYEFVYGTYSELYEKLKNGEIDVLPYTNYNEKRGTEVLFSDLSLAEEEYYLACASGDARFEERDPAALNGKIITTLEGADYNSLLTGWLKENGIEAEVRYFPSLEETWDSVREKSANATVFTSNAYTSDGFTPLFTFGSKPTYIAVSKDRPDLLEKLNSSTKLIETQNPALLGDLYAKYFSDNPMRMNLTAEERQWDETHSVLRVGGFSANPTDLLISEDGTASGINVDIVDGIISKLGLNLKTEYSTYDTLEEAKAALEGGKIDVFYPFYPDRYIAQERGLITSKTVRVTNMELVYRKGTSFKDALSKVATPTVRLGAFYVSDFYPEAEIVPASSVPDSVEKVLSGDALGAVAYSSAIHKEAEKHEDDLNTFILPDGCGTCFASLPENNALIMLLSRGLNYFTSSEIAVISSKYTEETEITTKAYLATHKEALILVIVIVSALVIMTILVIELIFLRRKAQAANRAKTEFLFNMSHDIRTPMNAIKGFTEKAIRHRDDPEVLSDSLLKAKTSGEYLLKIINDILDMARIESGKLEINREMTCIDDGNNVVLEMFGAEAAKKGIAFHTDFDIRDRYLIFDGDRTLQIIANLLSNAIKYTPEGGEIWYSVLQKECQKEGYAKFVITVKDTGCGMSAEFLRKVFDAFERDRSAIKSGAQGTGLGMSIVRKLADAMDYKLDITSAPGEGTEITVTALNKIASEEEIKAFLAERGTETAVERDFSGMKVLLAEDNEMNREIATDILEDRGISADGAPDGAAAVEMLREKGPDYYDFILMDIQMPIMNGYEATKAIREMYPERHIPIIALSANAFEEDRAASLASGMDGHVAKPINTKELFAVLAKLI